MKTKIFFVLVVAVILYGCSSTPAVQIVSTSTAELATPTTVSSVPATPTHSLSATVTPIPSATLINDIQLTPTVQVEDEMCQTAGYLGLANDNYPNIYHSPNGKWSFVICEKGTGDNITYPFLIFKSDGNKPWLISTNNIASELVNKFSDTTFQPVYWTSDEKKLYVRASLPCPDSFECYVYEDGESLYKLDLENKKISTILPPYISSPRFSYAFSISPDEKYLAFVDQANPSLVHIRNLVSGGEKMVKVNGKFLRTGAFVWTPDSQEFAFSSVLLSNDNFFSSIYRYSISNRSLVNLINEYLGVLFPNKTKLDENKEVIHWYNQDVLYIESIDQGYWRLNIRTKELTPEP